MKTTKKDVADEGLIYMQGVSRKAEDESEVNPSTEVVDLQDVHISIPPYQRPIGMVSPMTKDPSSQSSFSASGGEPPVRPARSHRQSSFDSSPSLSGGGMHSPMITSSLSQPASTSPGDPINIHVSVTINAPPGSSPPTRDGAAGVGGGPPSASSGTTLSDLKKARSMSRNHVVNAQNNAFPGAVPCCVPLSLCFILNFVS